MQKEQIVKKYCISGRLSDVRPDGLCDAIDWMCRQGFFVSNMTVIHYLEKEYAIVVYVKEYDDNDDVTDKISVK